MDKSRVSLMLRFVKIMASKQDCSKWHLRIEISSNCLKSPRYELFNGILIINLSQPAPDYCNIIIHPSYTAGSRSRGITQEDYSAVQMHLVPNTEDNSAAVDSDNISSGSFSRPRIVI